MIYTNKYDSIYLAEIVNKKVRKKHPDSTSGIGFTSSTVNYGKYLFCKSTWADAGMKELKNLTINQFDLFNHGLGGQLVFSSSGDVLLTVENGDNHLIWCYVLFDNDDIFEVGSIVQYAPIKLRKVPQNFEFELKNPYAMN